MKEVEIRKIIATQASTAIAICRRHGVGVKALRACGSLNRYERQSSIGRVYVCLNDKEPGWRVYDDRQGPSSRHGGRRSRLREDLKKLFSPLNVAVRIQANYSKLAVINSSFDS